MLLVAAAAASLSLLLPPLPASLLLPPLPAGRWPPPLMQTDTGGAAVRIRGFDVWAGSSPLIIGVDWTIMPNERWALLGGNGCGKSTLLRAIGEAALGEDFEGGALQVSSQLRFGMLEQTAVSGATSSVRDEVMSRMGPFQAAKAALEAAEAACTSGSASELEALERAQARPTVAACASALAAPCPPTALALAPAAAPTRALLPTPRPASRRSAATRSTPRWPECSRGSASRMPSSTGRAPPSAEAGRRPLQTRPPVDAAPADAAPADAPRVNTTRPHHAPAPRACTTRLHHAPAPRACTTRLHHAYAPR